MAKKKNVSEQEPQEQFETTGAEATETEVEKERCMSFRATPEFTERVRALCDKTGISYAKARTLLTEQMNASLADMNLREFFIRAAFGPENGD